jgi:hypothetical protein
MRLLVIHLAVLVLQVASLTAIADESATAKQYQDLLEQYEQEGGSRTFAKRFLALAEQHPKDQASADALLWVVKKLRGKPDTDRALDLLLKHHVASEKIGAGCKTIGRARSIKSEKLLRAIMAKNPEKQAQGQACFYLATLIDEEARIAEQLKTSPDLAARILDYYGPEYGKHLASLKPTELSKQRETVYARMLKSFPDATVDDTKFSDVAIQTLFAIRHLSVGKLAPEITGQEVHGQEMKLSKFRGKVVMLSFWGHW